MPSGYYTYRHFHHFFPRSVFTVILTVNNYYLPIYHSTYWSYAVLGIDTHWTENHFLVLFSVFIMLTKTFKYSTSIQVTVAISFEK